MRKIPTYQHNGDRRRDYSAQTLEHLANTGVVLVERNGEGEITIARFLAKTRAERPRASIPTGTYYSFEDILPDTGHRAWTHKNLEADAARLLRNEKQEVETLLKRIFRAVPLSCIQHQDMGTISKLAASVSVGSKKLLLEAERILAEKGLRKTAKRIRQAEERRVLRKARKQANVMLCHSNN